MTVRRTWDHLASTYQKRVFSIIEFAEKRRKLLAAVPSGTILDLGCGPLPYLFEELAALPGRRVIAADFSLSMLMALRHTLAPNSPTLIQTEGHSLGLGDSQVDACIAVNSILPEQRAEVDLIFGNISRILRPGGTLIAVLPSFEMSVLAAQNWNINLLIDSASHREYDTTGWQCYYTVDDIERLMTVFSFSSFHLSRLYFTADEEIAAIQRVYGSELSLDILRQYPLFEHFLVARR